MAPESPIKPAAPKQPADVSVEHLSWLVPARFSNEKASLLLYSVIDKHKSAFAGPAGRNNRVVANMLAGACFALWRAVFLTDNKTAGEEHLEHVSSFLGNLIANNTVGYAQDRNDRNFTFIFYTQDARYRLEKLIAHKPLSHLVSKDQLKKQGSDSKRHWTHLQSLLTGAISKFDEFLVGELENNRKAGPA